MANKLSADDYYLRIIKALAADLTLANACIRSLELRLQRKCEVDLSADSLPALLRPQI